MNLVVVGLAVLVIVLLYVLFKYYNSTATTLFSQATLVSTTSPITITNHPQSIRYAIGMWVYIQNWDNLNQKPLFTIPTIFSMYLERNSPVFKVSVVQNDNQPVTIQVSENFPLQRWTHVVAVVDSQYVDVYMDGKMVKSIIMDKPAATPSVDTNGAVTAQLGYSLSGKYVSSNIMLARITRWSSPISPQEVWNEYAKGNGQNITTMFHTYGVSFNLTQDGGTAASYKLL